MSGDFYGSAYWSDDELDELKGRRERPSAITAEVFRSARLGWSWNCAGPHDSPDVLMAMEGDQTMPKTLTPLPPCRVCKTSHGDLKNRDESCAVLAAEKRIADLYHNGGKASDIRYAQADREEALEPCSLKAVRFRIDGDCLKSQGR